MGHIKIMFRHLPTLSQVTIILMVYIFLTACQPNIGIDQTIQSQFEYTKINEIKSSSLPLNLLWQIEFENALAFRSLKMVQNIAVIPTEKGIYGIDLQTGTELWSHGVQTMFSYYPFAVNNEYLIYANSDGRTLYKIDIVTGDVKWRREFDMLPSYRILDIDMTDEVVYIGTQPTFVMALDLNTGDTLWRIDGIEQGIDSRGVRINFALETLYILTSDMHLVSPKTGEIIRMIEGISGHRVQINDRGYWTDDTVYDLNTLRVLHKFHLCEESLLPYKLDTNRLYITAPCGGVSAFSYDTYQQLWEYQSDWIVNTPIVIYDDNVYSLFANGELHAIDPSTGQETGKLVTDGTSYMNQSGLFTNGDVLLAVLNNHQVWAFASPKTNIDK